MVECVKNHQQKQTQAGCLQKSKKPVGSDFFSESLGK